MVGVNGFNPADNFARAAGDDGALTQAAYYP